MHTATLSPAPLWRIRPTPNSSEFHVPENEFIYSRTDLRGNIVEANEAFAKISGYRQDELIGQPHNMVRHPDMPKEAFEDMWRELKAGRPWRGLVKNLRKDGGYYWVAANAAPVREKGQVVGFQSVRSRPTRDEVRAAEAAYASIRKGGSNLTIRRGQAVSFYPPIAHRIKSATLQMWVSVLVGIFVLATLSLGSAGMAPEWLFYAATGVTAAWLTMFVFALWLPLRADVMQLRKYLQTLASTGDLRHTLELTRPDSIGDVASELRIFVSATRAMIQGMEETARIVAANAEGVGEQVAHVAEASAQQTDATSSAAASVEEMAASMDAVADSTDRACKLAKTARAAVANGRTQVESAGAQIQVLANAIASTAETMERLGERSSAISKMSASIRDIAEQTNLLALNAAIEAARAGDVGRGFAVVADEVRKLADRTNKATVEISEMVLGIQNESTLAAAAMREQVTAQAGASVELVGVVASSLTDIDSQVADTTENLSEVALATQEQRQAVHELSKELERIALMTEQNATGAARSLRQAEELQVAAVRTKKAVGQFTV